MARCIRGNVLIHPQVDFLSQGSSSPHTVVPTSSPYSSLARTSTYSGQLFDGTHATLPPSGHASSLRSPAISTAYAVPLRHDDVRFGYPPSRTSNAGGLFLYQDSFRPAQVRTRPFAVQDSLTTRLAQLVASPPLPRSHPCSTCPRSTVVVHVCSEHGVSATFQSFPPSLSQDDAHRMLLLAEHLVFAAVAGLSHAYRDGGPE